jgi:hypothetical protein
LARTARLLPDESRAKSSPFRRLRRQAGSRAELLQQIQDLLEKNQRIETRFRGLVVVVVVVVVELWAGWAGHAPPVV